MMKLVVLSCVLAAASASALWGAPFVYSSPLLNNYRGPLSLAPGQPANVLGWDGRPLDTLDVNLDRSAHLVAKAFNGVHVLKKRSVVPVVAPALAHTSLIAPAVPLGYGRLAPYSLAPYAYSPYARYASPLFSHW